MKIAVSGSSGLIGSALTASLRADGHQVVRLVRRPPRGADEARWDPRAADAGLPGSPATTPLNGLDACVHLAGAGLGDHRWTPSYKAEIRASRVLATRALATALTRLEPRPEVLISGSAIGWYGGTGGREVTEDAPAGKGFLSRVAHIRSGLVLGKGGGVLARLALPARFGLLPRFGDGSQLMSWIALTDEIAAIRFLLDHPECRGPFNLTAPHPVSDGELTAALHAAFRRPDLSWLRVPEFALRLALGEMSSELLNSARVLPKRLLEAGFGFSYMSVGAALRAELGR
jgi:uncharacterized protein